MNALLDQIKKTKNVSYDLVLLTERQRNAVLKDIAVKLHASIPQILAANARDLERMDSDNSMYDRLLLTDERIKSMANDIQNVLDLEDPIGHILESKVLSNQLQLKKVCVPLGVVAVIYEARPNVTIDVFTLCFKSANACILKGGKEAIHSNQILVQIIQEALVENNIDQDVVCLLVAGREDTSILLHATGLIDVCIPRGSNELINFVRDNAKIPVIETGAGIVHAFFDQGGDLIKGKNIINNAKTRRVSVCNALDCLIIHNKRLHDLPALVEPLTKHAVEIYADEESFAALKATYPQNLLQHAHADDFGHEFLAYKMAVKTVNSIDAAIDHIKMHTSGHSEVIITEDQSNADYFIQRIDAAVIYVNASTAFTDGAQFGLGSEIGISTQKLHARGPMGLAALTSYKWIVHGNGQIRP